MALDDLEQARLDIELERLEIEKANARLGRSFFRSNSGFLISAAVSLAAVIVSLSQVWITKITKDKELEIASIQKRSELDLQDKQKERELMLLEAQKKREWDLSAAKFIADNRKPIFNGTQNEQRLFAKIIGAIYPTEVSASILARIEKNSPPAARENWREARRAIEQSSVTVALAEPRLKELQQNDVPSEVPPLPEDEAGNSSSLRSTDLVLIRNVNSQRASFFLRKGTKEWVSFVLEAGANGYYQNVNQISILTVGKKTAQYTLEQGKRYDLFWNATMRGWDLRRVELR